MKVLLLQDVYKLGRAGDVKRVADGYGRNYLIPQHLATLATPGALRQADRIRSTATVRRSVLNQEMSGIAERLKDMVLYFPVRASETEKLYGSVSPKMIADVIKEKIGLELDRNQIDHQPIRMLGEYKIPVRLTVDLVPVIKAVVYREGQTLAEASEAEAARVAMRGQVIEVSVPAEEPEVEAEETGVAAEPETEAAAQ